MATLIKVNQAILMQDLLMMKDTTFVNTFVFLHV